VDPLFNTEPLAQVIDDTKEYLPELVGDGKKFKTNEDLAKSVLHKDNFIEQLKRENDEYRRELAATDRVKDILDKIVSKPPSVQVEDNQPPREEPAKFDPKQVEELVKKNLLEQNQELQKQANLKRVTDDLEKLWGSDWKAVLQSRQKLTYLSQAQLQAIAEQSPEAFLRIVGNVPATGAGSPPARTQNTDFRTTQSGTRNQAYYDNLRKSNPEQYWSVSTQKQRYDDALKQGAAFFT